MADDIPKSVFNRGSGNEATRSEANYLGSEAQDFSHMPPDLVGGNAETDEEMGTKVDWKGKDANQDVSQIKRALDEIAVRRGVVRVFKERASAEAAVRDLESAGFTAGEIGIMLRGSHSAGDHRYVGKGAVEGATAGAITGGVLGAMVSLAVPGIGPVLAAGALALALGFGATGAVAGGVIGAVAGEEVSEEEAGHYLKAFHRGHAIVSVSTPNRAADAVKILERNGGRAAAG